MNKALFLKEFFLDIVLPGIGLGLAGLAVFYYVLPKIFRLKRGNEENEEEKEKNLKIFPLIE